MYDLTTYDAAQQRYQELLQKMERERLIQTLPPAEGRTVLTQTLWRLGQLMSAIGFWLWHQVALRPSLSER